MNRLGLLWVKLRTSLWFLPTLLVSGAVALAFALIWVDTIVPNETLARWPLLFGAGADGSRSLLSAIAGSMITVAGVTFSITIVALSLTASQYSSRVLRNFMGDRGNQAVLGVFLAVFAYCLIVLRVIRGGDENPFVPEISVLVGVILAIVAIGFLIYFIHHIAGSIQAASIAQAAAHETLRAINRLFPDELGEGAELLPLPDAIETTRRWRAVPSLKTGYLQHVESDRLLGYAKERGVLVRMERAIGEFVVEGTPIASVAAEAEPADEEIRALDAAYVLGRQRTVEQDAAFGIQQIVDIALKALSPGVNDTTTAVICIDHLSEILARAATRRLESPYRSANGPVRVISRGPTIETLLSNAFDQVRRNAERNVAALLRVLDALASVATVTRSSGRRALLRRHVELLWEVADRTVEQSADRERLEERRNEVMGLLAGGA